MPRSSSNWPTLRWPLRTSQRHAALTTIAAELQEQQTQSQAALTQTIEARDTLAQQLQEAAAALGRPNATGSPNAALAARLRVAKRSSAAAR